MDFIKNNIDGVLNRIRIAEKKANVEPNSVKLLAVSKTMPTEYVKTAIDCGLKEFGENYIQEGIQKAELFQDYATWHFIGHLQKNKVKLAVAHFDVIQTIDSIELAEKISRVAVELGRKLDVFIEVHFGDESTKTGFLPEDAEKNAQKIACLDNINLKGLMTIPPLTENPNDNKCHFENLRKMSERIFAGCNFKPVLSMGMTADLEVAISEGSNMVRVGTGIFGPRKIKN